MEQQLRAIPVTYSDPEVNQIIKSIPPQATSYSRHYTESEDFVLRLPSEYAVGSTRIHHDVRSPRPEKDYLAYLRGVIMQLAPMLPDVFGGMTHLFDPTEIFMPTFFRLYRYKSQQYVYLLRLDLHYRPAIHTRTERGTNDNTTSFRTNSVVMEADFIPLADVQTRGGKIHGLVIEQSVSDTWIGQTGRFYNVEGIWIDKDLTRFFSKLFTPPGLRTYPFYVFTCKYRAVCHTVVTLDEKSRQKGLPLLHEARAFILPRLREIENSIGSTETRERWEIDQNPVFHALRSEVGSFDDLWRDFSMRVYLNKDDRKEYELEHGIF